MTHQRTFETFIGVDLGGGKGKNTAVALLRRAGESVRVQFVGLRSPDSGLPFYDKELAAFLLEHVTDGLVAMDAPLSLPVCLRCTRASCPGLGRCDLPVLRWFREVGDPLVTRRGAARGKPATTPYTQRACEVLLHRRHGVLPRETLGQGMGPLTARAHFLRHVLTPRFQVNANLIEVYPKATIHALFGADWARRYKREARTWQVRAGILEGLSERLHFDVWREGVLQNDHNFDALIAAYTGFLWATQGWELPPVHREIFAEDGWIWHPPLEEVEEE